MIEYVKNKKESTEKLLELSSKFIKLLNAESICKKKTLFACTTNKHLETEIKVVISFTNKEIKYIRINLMKDV